jgi:acyl carrier protein
MEKIDFTNYSDDELRIIYNEEYIPWTKTGILHNGELRNIFNELHQSGDTFALITTEKTFINECAWRFVNSVKKKASYSPPPTVIKSTKELTPREIIRDRVYEIIIDHLGCDENEVTEDANLRNDLGADSLDHIEIMMKIEHEFNITIPDDQADKARTVKDAVDITYQTINSKN